MLTRSGVRATRLATMPTKSTARTSRLAPPLAPLLRAIDACPDAIAWAEGRTIGAAAWEACTRPDWMVWLALVLGQRGTPLWRGALLVCADVVRQKMAVLDGVAMDAATRGHVTTACRGAIAAVEAVAALGPDATTAQWDRESEMARGARNAAEAASNAVWAARATGWIASDAAEAARNAASTASNAAWTARATDWIASDEAWAASTAASTASNAAWTASGAAWAASDAAEAASNVVWAASAAGAAAARERCATVRHRVPWGLIGPVALARAKKETP